MNSVMLGLMLSGWEILILLLVLLVMAGLAVGAILLVVWLTRRRPQETPAPPPVQRPEPPKPVPSICPRCGTPLPADSPQGLCPRCVMGVGLATHTETGEAVGPNGTKIVKPPAPACEEVARHFPHLEILECLGRGGMGVVYKARQPKLNRLVALKILAPEKGADPKFAERFLREAQALARLNHPNIVTVHDFGEADGMFYLLMEYVDGVTLRELLREGRMKPEQALAIVPKICEALQFAHEQGIVHRDIKPENVLLDKQGRVKIADFGIAKIVEARNASARRPGEDERTAGPAVATNLTQDQVLGTPHYMAPEQVEHPQTVDHRADIYSLGVVFYEMLTGELPLGKFQPPSKKVQVDVRLDEVVLHALEKEPERRYQHVSEVKSDVETIAQSPPPPSAPANGPEMVRRLQLLRWKSTSFFVAAGGFLVAALLFAALGVTIAVLLNLAGLVAYGIAGYRIRQRAGDLEVTIRGLPSGMKDLDFGPPPVATMLNAIVVGTRNGRRVINWPGVIPAWLLLSILISFVFWGLCRLVGMQLSLWASAAYGLVCSSIVVGSGVARSWSLPKDKLMPLDGAAPAGPIAAAPKLNEVALARARAEVKHPASWLVATGILNWIAIPFIVMVILLFASRNGGTAAPAIFALVAALFLSSAMILAGLKMKRLEAYSLAVLGSILAIFITPGNIIGLPVGIWCLVTLFRRDVREAFGKARLLPRERGQPKRGGMTWKVAALVGGLILFWFVILQLNLHFKQREVGILERQIKVLQGTSGAAEVTSSFGPVIERKLSDVNPVSDHSLIDLDTGKTFTPPPRMSLTDPWLAQNGVDAVVAIKPGFQGLVVVDMSILQTSPEQWDAMTAVTVSERIALATPAAEQMLNNRGNLPATYLFKTREGGSGVLQITALTDAPRAVKIRYKLVRPLVPRADLDQDIPLARALEESKAIFPDGPPLTEEEVVAAVRAIKIHHPDIPEAAYQIYQRVVNERVLPRGMYFDRVRGWNPGNARYDVDWRDLTLDFDRAGIKGHPPGMIFNYRVRARFLGSGPRGPSGERPTQTSSTALGPAVERVLYSVATQRPIEGEDLDSGREIEVPAELEKAGEDQFFHWLATHGVDLLAFGDQQHWALWTSLHLASVSAATWERPVTADLLAALKSGAVGLERAEPDVKEGFVFYRLSTNPGFPLTYAFQTRAGGVGVLQISGFTDSPRGVKIRYKLVKTSGSLATRDIGERQRLAQRAAASASDQSALHWAELSRVVERLIAGQPARTGYDFEIWEKVPGGAGEYRIRADVQQFELKPPTPEISLPRGKVYFLPASNRFYVQWDSPLASTLHYYGPFAGDPIKMLGLATPDSAR